MKLNSFPQMNPKPVLRSAEAAHEFTKAQGVEKSLNNAFSDYGQQLANLDNSDIDFNPEKGEVVVADRYLDNGPDTATQVSGAQLSFDPQTGDVDRFKVITDDQNSMTFEYKRYDESRSSNPTFTSVVNGQSVSYEINPNTGSITSFEG